MEDFIFETAMRSKLTIVLDENVLSLAEPLRLLKQKVIIPKRGLKDTDIIQFLDGKAILTKNSKDFIPEAVVYNFDIISLDKIKFLDSKQDESNQTAKRIVEAIRESKFVTVDGVYQLVLLENDKWKLNKL
jgi:hypothetical protein